MLEKKTTLKVILSLIFDIAKFNSKSLSNVSSFKLQNIRKSIDSLSSKQIDADLATAKML